MIILDNAKVYVAKNNEWFDAGTIVALIDDYRPDMKSGLFIGMKNGSLDEEICPFDEFDPVYITAPIRNTIGNKTSRS